jgi:NAD(P)H dehydrogenase (quinone)
MRHLSGELAGKVAAVFCAPSATQGAQRSALLSMTIPLLRCGFLVQAPTRAEIETMGAAAGPRDSVPPASRPAAAREPAEPDLSRARALGRRLALAGAPSR